MSDEEFARYEEERRDCGVDMWSLDGFEVHFEEAWSKAVSLSSAFPMPEWDWDVVRFELMAFVYAHVLYYAQKEGRSVLSGGYSGLNAGFAGFLQEVEQCVRFDICAGMAAVDGAVANDEVVELLLENRYELYSFKIGTGLDGVVSVFVLLVQLSLRKGCVVCSSQEVYAAEISTIFSMELDHTMRVFAVEVLPVLLPVLTSKGFLLRSWERMGQNVSKNDVISFVEVLCLRRDEARGQDGAGLLSGMIPESQQEQKEDQKKTWSFLDFSCRFRVLAVAIIILTLSSSLGVSGAVALACYSGKMLVALVFPVALRFMRKDGYGFFSSLAGGVVAWLLMAGYGGFLEYELGVVGFASSTSFLSAGVTAWLVAMAYKVMRSPSRKLKGLW